MNLIKEGCLEPDVPVNITDRITITGITKGTVPSYGSAILNVFETPVKFYVMPNNLKVPDDGILGGEYFFQEQVTISYFHKSIVTISRPISPIPFLHPQHFFCNDEPYTLPLKTPVLTLKARTRHVVPIEVLNAECKEGYLPRIDAGEGVLMGNAAVTNENGHCYVMAINVGYEDVNIQIAPQKIEPYEVYSLEADPSSPSESDEELEYMIKKRSGPRLSKRQRIRRICELVGVDKLNPDERESVIRLIEEFPYLFFIEGDEFPGTTLEQHTIPTTDDVPLVTKQYRYPPIHKEEIRKQIGKLLELGVIKESNSPYNSPLWIVPKKADAHGNRKWRMVIDFRALNAKTVGDAYPLPNITEILDNLGKAKYFSVFDLASGFHQIPMDPADSPKTAFSTDRGHYEYLRMPFGLKGAPATFQRLMDRVLTGLQGTELFVYLDDIVIFAASIEEHAGRAKRLFARLSAAGLRLQPEKCAFLSTKIKYLGHIITESGVSPDPDKVKAVQNFPIPKNPRNIREFLGLVGYYRKFIADFAARTKPLSDLLKKRREFVWTEQQQHSFQDMKDSLTRAPILQFPDFGQPFVLTTDASDFAIGAVLSQGKLGHDLPVAYASRLLSKAERNYSASERECLAVVEYVRHFRHYLYGQNFLVVTDHQALRWLHSVKDPSSRLMRWRLKLRDYQYEIVYKSGKTNKNADALSRNPSENYDEGVVQEIRVLPMTYEQVRRRPGRPRKEPGKAASNVSACDESDAEFNEGGIAGRVKSRNQSKPKPDYKETPLKTYHRLASSSSDSESSRPAASSARRARRGRMRRYEDDDEYVPPSFSEKNPISIENLFREEPCPSSSSTEMIIEVDPGQLLDLSSYSETALGDQSDDAEVTLQAPSSIPSESSIRILPPEDNPSDSESVYSEIESEEDETLTSPIAANETVINSNDKIAVRPQTPNLSNFLPSSQSTPIATSISKSCRKHLTEMERPPSTSSPRTSEGGRSPTLRLYETIPPESPVSPWTGVSSLPSNKSVNLSTVPDSLTMSRDNYAHFISADCNLVTPIGHLLTDLGYVSEVMLKEQRAKKGSVIVSQSGTIKVFSLVCRDRFFDTVTEDDLYIALNCLKDAMYSTGTKSVRISKVNDALENLPDSALRNIIRRVFSAGDLRITLCLGKVETPPPEKRKEIINEFHRSLVGGHKGVRKTYRRIRERFYWPDMVRQIQEAIKTCRSCQLNKLVRIKTRQPMILTDTPATAFDKVCLDTVGPLPETPRGNKHILTMQDNLTKYCLAIAVPDIRATTVADAFAREFIAIFGCPRAILSDRGTTFINRVFAKLTKIFKIKQLSTSAYHPQTNGGLERSHQVLADYLKHYLRDYDDWDTFLPFAMLSYNVSVHEGTKFSPYHLVFGREARVPSSYPSAEVLETYGSYLSELVTRLDEIRDIASKNLTNSKLRSKHYYDRHLNEKEFKLGDLVLKLKEPHEHKFDRYYEGPLEIVEIHPRNGVVLKDIRSGERVFKHMDKIKHFYPDSEDELLA